MVYWALHNSKYQRYLLHDFANIKIISLKYKHQISLIYILLELIFTVSQPAFFLMMSIEMFSSNANN